MKSKILNSITAIGLVVELAVLMALAAFICTFVAPNNPVYDYIPRRAQTIVLRLLKR